MATALQFIFDILVWVFVPLMLIIGLWTLYSFCKRMEDEKYRASAKAGYFGGFLLFVIAFIFQVGGYVQSGFPEESIFQGFNPWITLGAALIAFILAPSGKKIIPREWSGAVVLLGSSAGFYALAHYLFIRTWNEFLLSLILGISFGAFAFIASSPALIRQFLEFLRTK